MYLLHFNFIILLLTCHRYGNQIVKPTKSRYKIKVDNSVKSWDSSKSIFTDWRIIYLVLGGQLDNNFYLELESS